MFKLQIQHLLNPQLKAESLISLLKGKPKLQLKMKSLKIRLQNLPRLQLKTESLISRLQKILLVSPHKNR